jgi:integrase
VERPANSKDKTVRDGQTASDARQAVSAAARGAAARGASLERFHVDHEPHLPMHGLRHPFGTWVYEQYGVRQVQEWLGHSDPGDHTQALCAPHHRHQGEGGDGLDEVTRAALERAEETAAEHPRPPRDNVVELASRR